MSKATLKEKLFELHCQSGALCDDLNDKSDSDIRFDSTYLSHAMAEVMIAIHKVLIAHTP